MNKKIKVICKETCRSAGGATFYENKIYDCEVLNDTYFVFDRFNSIIRLENNANEELSKFSTYFYTEKKYRKEKLLKISESQ